jgi:four helix bundle protein
MTDDKSQIANDKSQMSDDRVTGGGVRVGRLYERFEEMPVWGEAQDLAVEVYGDMANVRDFSFSDQIKRAAVSISNNIAEGAERATAADFARFLDIAKGSAGEVRSMILLATRLGFLAPNTTQERIARCLSISRQLAAFAKHLRK